MAVNRVHKNIGFLKNLCHAKHKRSRNKKIKSANDVQIRSVCELCLNLLQKNIPISRYKERKLLPYKKVIKVCSKRGIPLSLKRRVLQQKGGFLPLLASVLLPLAASWLQK